MTTPAPIHDREAIGAAFSMPVMLRAQARTWEGLRQIAAQIRPGMTERQAIDQAEATLQALGMDRLWHKT